jgi:predicted transcriptional regulator
LSTSRPYTLRVAGDLRVRIEAQAEKLGCSPSEIVRRAIEQHLDGLKLLHDSSRRHLRVTEYMQVALDAIIRENHPELRETLILEADRRMKLHHGA